MKTNGGWTRSDVWLGALFLATGILILAFAFAAIGNGVPLLLWAPSLALGSVLVVLGANGVIRSLRADSPK